MLLMMMMMTGEEEQHFTLMEKQGSPTKKTLFCKKT
jgi:hypothetical protein